MPGHIVECFESIRTTFDINVKPFALSATPTAPPTSYSLSLSRSGLFKALSQRVEEFVQMQKIIRKDYSPDTPNSNQCDALPFSFPSSAQLYHALSLPLPYFFLQLDKLVVVGFRVFLASRSKFNFACLTRRPRTALPPALSLSPLSLCFTNPLRAVAISVCI